MLYTAVFGLYSLMEVLGLMPQEVRSAGITLPALFSRLYGDQVGTLTFSSAHAPHAPLWGKERKQFFFLLGEGEAVDGFSIIKKCL